jgi:hypothetical protein
MISKKEYIEKIRESYNKWLSSDNLKTALEIRNIFHPYSINNRLLIYVQNEFATVCAGYKTWLNVKRYVKKGEKGLTIYAPAMGFYFKDKLVNGKTESVKMEYIKGYFPVKIFDVSQTDGEPLETVTFEIAGDNFMLLEKVKTSLESKGYLLTNHDNSELLGIPVKDNKISFRRGSPDQELAGIFSSMAYKYLNKINNVDEDIVAAATAYLTLANIGIDASEFMAKYIASLNRFKDFDAISDFISASNFVSKKIERELDINFKDEAA